MFRETAAPLPFNWRLRSNAHNFSSASVEFYEVLSHFYVKEAVVPLNKASKYLADGLGKKYNLEI